MVLRREEGPLSTCAATLTAGPPTLPPSCTVENHVDEVAPKAWGGLFLFCKNVMKILVSEEDSTLRFKQGAAGCEKGPSVWSVLVMINFHPPKCQV